LTTSFRPLRALVRHHDPLLAAGIGAALETCPGMEIVEAGDEPHAQIDVLICDYESGMEWRGRQRSSAGAERQGPGVVVITWRDSEADVRAAMQAGIGGYLLGSCGVNELVEAVRCVHRGSPYLCSVAATRVARSLSRTPLTLRENEILQLMASGMPNKLIASQLCIALGTVKAHAKAILDKLGARSRTHATVIAAERGLLSPHSPLLPASVHTRRPMSSPPGVSTHEHSRMAA
jgi:DNA-binding NarL/FixJ family response regulator